LSSTASIRLKIAVFAPIPSASDSTATAAKAGFFASMRRPYFKSWRIVPVGCLSYGSKSAPSLYK